MTLLDEFIRYLYDEVDNRSIYVWGGQGQRGSAVTKEWISKRESDPKNAKRAISFWEKQCNAGYADRLGAFDCSGLGMYFLQNLKGVYPYDLNANGMMSKCKSISRSELKRGDWVFMTSGGRATHIGYVVDDLMVIEARGRDHGVCISHVDKRAWQCFGRPEIFKKEIESDMLSKGDKGDKVRALQCALISMGYHLDKYGADGSFGNETLEALVAFKREHQLGDGKSATSSDASALGFKAGFELTEGIAMITKGLMDAQRAMDAQKKIITEVRDKLCSIV